MQGDAKVFAGVLQAKSAEDLRGVRNIEPIVVDVTSDVDVAAALARMTATLAAADGVLCGVVNNAGVMIDLGPVELSPLSNLRTMLAVNVEGTARVTKAVLPLLRAARARAGTARVVNVASMLGRFGCPLQGFYSASKHAVVGLSDALRREVRQFGVHVSIVEPGAFPSTNLFTTYFDGLERLWRGATEAQRQAYGEAWRAEVQEVSLKVAGLGNTRLEDVVEAMEHALLAPHPLYRYRLGVDSKFGPWALPEFMIDPLMNGAPTNCDVPGGAAYNSKMQYAVGAALCAFALAKL